MRASKLARSARPTEPQLGTLGKNLAIQSPMPIAAAIAIAMRTAKTMPMTISTTTSSKESRIGRQLPESDSWLRYTGWNEVLG
jgi:hypothetical protein